MRTRPFLRWSEFGVGVGIAIGAAAIVFGAWLWIRAAAYLASWL